jgi:hypothetical protein
MRQRGNGAGTVYACKNQEGKITSYRGFYFPRRQAALRFSQEKDRVRKEAARCHDLYTTLVSNPSI